MFESSVLADPVELSAGALLAAVRDARAVEQRAAAQTLVLAYQWAVLHPALEAGEEAVFAVRGGDRVLHEPISGEGCPLVAEYAVPELGTVLGVSTDAAKKLLGHAVELRHRLPRLWALVQEGRVPAWRARQVAEETIHATPRLSVEGAGWVDRQVAAVTGRIGPAQLSRVVAEAIERHQVGEPVTDDDAVGVMDPRRVTLEARIEPFARSVRITAELDVADALDVDHAVRVGAEELKALGSQESLDVRRSMALGHLARRQLALDLSGAAGAASGAGEGRDLGAARRLDLHVHLTADTADTTDTTDTTDATDFTGGSGLTLRPTAALENGQRLVLLEQVRQWCAGSATEVRILPVLDLNAEIESAGYVPSPTLRRQVQLRDRTCVFPWCSRPARGCDLDHVDPYDPDQLPVDGVPPQTRTSNLATLCRFHHRLKTHTAWRLASPANGVFLWTSPHGHRYRRDRHGTASLDPPADP